MYLIGEDIHIEDEQERRIAYIAAIASDPTRPTRLPQIENLEVPFSLLRGSKDIIAQGLANIALGDGIPYEDVTPELAESKLTELFGELEAPDYFDSPLPENEQRHY